MDEKDSQAQQEVQFLKGHYYVDPVDERLFRYIKRGMGGKGPKQYCFRLLAQNGVQVSQSSLIRYSFKPTRMVQVSQSSLIRYSFKPTRMVEVPEDDLPLYVSWQTFPAFEKALKEMK